MRAGKVGVVAGQVLVGLILVMEVIYLACFFGFFVPPLIQVFEEADAPLPGPMLLVLHLAEFLRDGGVPLLLVVLLACAVGWGAFEFACRSERKPLIRLTVGGSIAVVLGLVAVWVSLVSGMALRQIGRQEPAALTSPARLAVQSLAPRRTESDIA